MFRPIQYNNVRFYLFIFFLYVLKLLRDPHQRSTCRPSSRRAVLLVPKKDTSLQTTFCGYFFLLCDSFHSRCSVCVAVVTACLSCAVSRTPQRINVKKAFIFIYFFFLCAYVLRGRCAHWRPATTTRGFDLFLCRIDAEMEAEFHRPTSFTAFSKHLFSFYCVSTQLKFSPPPLVNCPKSKIWYTIFFRLSLEIALRACRGHPVAAGRSLHSVDLIQLVVA